MAQMLDVNPTRGNLLKLEGDLRGMRTRYRLLDRKREVLIRELMNRMEKARGLEEESRDLIGKAHRAMQLARMRMGADRIEWISLSPTAEVGASVSIGTIMGLRIPAVELEVRPVTPPYGMADTSAALDEARESWIDVLRFVSKASGVMNSVWRIASELRKTQRQVNALEHTIMPRYERTISHIESRLEEGEREDIVQARKIKELKEET